MRIAKGVSKNWPLILVLFFVGATLGAIVGFWVWVQIHGPNYFNSWWTGALVVGGTATLCGLLLAKLSFY